MSHLIDMYSLDADASLVADASLGPDADADASWVAAKLADTKIGCGCGCELGR